MTFNIQHCRNYLEDRIDFQIMADAIKQCGADVVGLNEVRDKGCDPDYEAQAKILSELTGLKYYYFAKACDFPSGPYGNAILSRYPLSSVETVLIPDPNPRKYDRNYETRCVLKAEIEGGLTVLISHFGLNPDEKENAVATVMANLKPSKCVLMGDFNVTPDSPLLAPIRAAMCDTADKFSEPKLSFPSDKPDRKLDYVFVSPDVELESADIPEIVASDHRPHVAEIKL